MKSRAIFLALFILIIAVYFLYKERVTSLGASVAELRQSKNTVQGRKAGSLVWEDIPVGQGFQYYDSVLTMKDSSATLKFTGNGTDLDMGPESLVVIERPVDKNSELRLDLKYGSATVKIKKGNKIEFKEKAVLAKEDSTVALSKAREESAAENIHVVLSDPKEDSKQASPVEITALIEPAPTLKVTEPVTPAEPLRVPATREPVSPTPLAAPKF